MRPPHHDEIMDASFAWLARRDGSVVVGHGPFVASATPPERGVAFYVQDFAMHDRRPWKIPAEEERVDRTGLAKLLPVPAQVPGWSWQAPDPGPFSLVFQEIMAAIHAGGFEKTVPVVAELGISNSPPGAWIAAAMARQQAPLQSYGWVGTRGGFAGATPELLFSLAGTSLETMALAGTARSDDRDVFAVDEKEVREHEYVAQTLVSKLLDLGHLERHPRCILELGSIVHFLSRIGVSLHRPAEPDMLLRKLHPTPALGPLPRTHETMRLLSDWRARLGCPDTFGAPFGIWDAGRFEAVVAIRGVWWHDCETTIPAGCGLIEASRLVNEWRELRLKREAVKRFLAI